MGLADDSEETRRIGVWDLPPMSTTLTNMGLSRCTHIVNAMFMAYSLACPSKKSSSDLQAHLAVCFTQDPRVAVLEALDILRDGIEKGEWFDDA